MKKYIVGIISYLPDEELGEIRKQQLEKNLRKVYELFPSFPVLIIAQNYNGYIPEHPKTQKVIIKHYTKLGIVKARQILQQELLSYNFDYAILLDDDAIIHGNKSKVKQFLSRFEKANDCYCFRQKAEDAKNSANRYMSAALNFCVISKWILERESIDVRFDPQQNIAYEDLIWPSMIYNKYPEKELYWPLGTLFTSHLATDRTITTWALAANKEKIKDSYPRAIRWKNTLKICEYIDKYKKYPNFKLADNKEVIIIEEGDLNYVEN